MKRALRFCLGGVLVFGQLSAIGQNQAIFFLVAEQEGFESHNDSYVVTISQPQEIQYARRLIAEGPGSVESPIPIAGIGLGSDGVNRDHLAPGKPPWSWHAVKFYGFSGAVIPEWPSSPAQVEQNPQNWMAPPIRGVFGFIYYTIVAELGPALELSITPSPTNLVFNWPNLSTNAAYTTQGTNLVYTVESKDSLISTNWVPVAGFTWPTNTNQVTVPIPSTPVAYYRVKAELGSP